MESGAATAFIRREVEHLARSERGTPDVTLSPKSRSGLHSYLEGPVHQQIQTELGRIAPDVGFIFGHTHKPFVEHWTFDGYPNPVTISNTGGWVVDSADPALSQGAAAVLLDDNLDTATLQFYRQTAAGGAAPVEVLTPTGDPSSGNPLQAALAAALDPTAEPWHTISQAAAELIAQRHRVQATLVQAGRRPIPT